jgi:arylsulfatase A-like enzyme
MTRRDLSPRASREQPPRRKTRPALLLAVVAVLGVAAWGLHRLAADRRPGARAGDLSVLLITLDTTRADHLGCYGGQAARTPNLDALAREGTLFARCTTCSPLTLPSHSSILTGVYPYVHGARQNGTGRLAESNLTLAEDLRQAGFATQATIASFVLNRRFGTAQGFDVYHDVVPAATGDPSSAERKGNEICDDACRMLESLAGKRFFLWVHFYDPHFPYESPRIPDTLSPLAYADEVTFMDTQIGRLLEKLRQLGRERDTLIVAVADHGEGLNDHEEWKHGYFLYQTTVHTPLILWRPGTIPAGKTITAQVRTIDIAPTILDLLGRPGWDHAQGVSLLPLVSGRQTDLNLHAYGETFEAHIQYGLSPLRSLSAGQWKYVLAPKPELYDLDADPGEQRNLAAEQPARAEQMRGQLRQLIADAPPPPAAEEATATLQASEVAILESLGYVGRGREEREGLTELDRFEPEGGNPRDYAGSFKLISLDLPQMLRRKEYQRAEQLLRAQIQALPDASYLYAHLAGVLESQQRMDEARAAFEQAVSMAPGDYVVRMKYGVFLRRMKQEDQALAQFSAVLQKVPDDTAALKQAALAHAALGQLGQAEQKLRRILEIEPENAGALRILGLVREQQDKLVEALRYFNEALAIDPDFSECEQDRQRVSQKLGW